MWTNLRARSLEAVEDVIQLLQDMALVDSRVYRALTTPDIPTHASTASTAPFRARTPESAPRESIIMAGGDGGNVKVVVRVRKFLKRGASTQEIRGTSSDSRQNSIAMRHALLR